MEDFHQQFSLDAVKKLKSLHKNLQSAEKISDSEKREIFRTLHTIKGTAQTFGFSASSRLAHELENVISAEKFITSENFQSLFTEGISFLINSFEQKDFEFPVQFAEKVHLTIPENLQSQISFDILLPEVPGGKIEINFKSEKSGLIIIVADNGNGINIEKLKTKALEKNLISGDEILNEQAAFDLISQSELSTAPEITEISGRGIGLDAVKTAIEKSGGTIKVKNNLEKGTIF